MTHKPALALLALLILAACGADGNPTPPGVTLSGDARVGVTSN
ncbi:MAG: hypothetical protein ACOH2M_05975 [Cypionkella sp.]